MQSDITNNNVEIMRLLELYDDFGLQYRYGYISDMVTDQNDKKTYNTENKINSTSNKTNTGNVRQISGN
jgi:hypothetical protein